jgi:hypothetical protein
VIGHHEERAAGEQSGAGLISAGGEGPAARASRSTSASWAAVIAEVLLRMVLPARYSS